MATSRICMRPNINIFGHTHTHTHKTLRVVSTMRDDDGREPLLEPLGA